MQPFQPQEKLDIPTRIPGSWTHIGKIVVFEYPDELRRLRPAKVSTMQQSVMCMIWHTNIMW